MKKTEESKKRAKFLFILIILTAILSITTTYTWFTMRRDVELSSLKVNVESVANMQISLDGETWAQSIAITSMDQLLGTADGEGLLQAKAGDHTNYVPTGLSPVSSDGTVEQGKLKFVTGVSTDGVKLTSIKTCSEEDIVKGYETESLETVQKANANHPYLAFDLYIRNLSTSDSAEPLQLNTGSQVWVDTDGVANTGLEYSARVAFIPYGTTMGVERSGADIRGISATGSETAAIWEPFDKEHTAALAAKNDRGITQATQAFTTYPVKNDTTEDIEDLRKTSEEETKLAQLDTIKTEYEKATGKTTGDAVNLGSLQLAANQITKVRIYIYLEGQDPDCVDLASTGKVLSATIKLSKPAAE